MASLCVPVTLLISTTGDLEWYTPDALKTENGNLVITMTKEPKNGLDYTSGNVDFPHPATVVNLSQE